MKGPLNWGGGGVPILNGMPILMVPILNCKHDLSKYKPDILKFNTI